MNQTRGNAHLIDTRALRVEDDVFVVLNTGCLRILEAWGTAEEIILPKGSVIRLRGGEMLEPGEFKITPLTDVPPPTVGRWLKTLKAPQPEFSEMAKPIMEAAARKALKTPTIEL